MCVAAFNPQQSALSYRANNTPDTANLFALGTQYTRKDRTAYAGTLTWNPTSDTVTITVGAITSGGSALQIGVAAKQAKYGPPAGLTDVAGNGLSTATFTAGATSGF